MSIILSSPLQEENPWLYVPLTYLTLSTRALDWSLIRKKSQGYYQVAKVCDRLLWTNILIITSVEELAINTLLDSPFEVSLMPSSIDEFLKNWINKKKNRYYYLPKLNSIRREVIANKIILFSLFFFTSI